MIKVNLAVKKQQFSVPVVMGVNLADVKWGLLLFSILFFYFVPSFVNQVWLGQRKELEDDYNQKKKYLQTLTREVDSHGDLKAQLTAFNKQVENLKERNAKVEEIIKLRTNPHYLLEKIARSTPEDVWFESLEINESKEFTINGKAREYRFLQDLLNQLNDSPFFEGKINITESKTIIDKESGDDQRLESFIMKGQVKIFDPFNE